MPGGAAASVPAGPIERRFADRDALAALRFLVALAEGVGFAAGAVAGTSVVNFFMHSGRRNSWSFVLGMCVQPIAFLKCSTGARLPLQQAAASQ